MALDGFVISNMAHECNEKLAGGRITKIAQPEKDELLLTIKNNRDKNREQYRLIISAGAGLPLMYLTETNKTSPITAPNFCMLLRKHLNNAKIIKIEQCGFERVIKMEVEHLDELGDNCRKFIMIELMGKHSNIIFCDDQNEIIDSIKRVPSFVSSVREVLPGREYFIPNTMDKVSPFQFNREILNEILAKPLSFSKSIYNTLTGFSPLIANEICYRANVDGDAPTASCTEEQRETLFIALTDMIEAMKEHHYSPNIIYHSDEPIEFSCIPLTSFHTYDVKSFDTISEVLDTFYASKEILTRIKQKSFDLRRTVNTALERNRKKYALQTKQLKDTEKRDKYKVYGELINTYGYELEPESKSLTCLNYYTNETITIPLDETLTPGENSKKYFDRYNKLKRTFEALTTQIKETSDDIEHLESISNALDIAKKEEDLSSIKEELIQFGYIKRKFTGKKANKNLVKKTKPLHYVSSDGYHIYVGKNNFQNDELTFDFATGNDWWFHAKGIAGSHVIVKSGNDELPDKTFEEAARLAAHYSKAGGNDKVEIDYLQKKNVKKPNGSKPGFVVYYTNYSMVISSDIKGIQFIED